MTEPIRKNPEENKDKKEKDFVIDNEAKADWALEKITKLKKKKKEKEQTAEIRIRQIKNWLDQQNQNINKNIEHLENLLRDYAEQLKEEDEDFKTKKLPFGKIQYRKQRPKWQYDDEKLTEYAEKSMPDIVKVEKKINKRDLKKKVEVSGETVVNPETGEVVEGVKVQERGEKLYIKPEM